VRKSTMASHKAPFDRPHDFHLGRRGLIMHAAQRARRVDLRKMRLEASRAELLSQKKRAKKPRSSPRFSSSIV
jgi:hypothetical protein